MKVIKASAVQISPVLHTREQTVEQVARKIHEPGQQEVRFASFPETVVPCDPYFPVVQTPEVDAPFSDRTMLRTSEIDYGHDQHARSHRP